MLGGSAPRVVFTPSAASGSATSRGDEREPRALEEHLQRQPAATGAEGQPHGKFLLALGAAGQQQIRDVGARNQQEQQRRHLPDGQERPRAGVRKPAGERHDGDLAPSVRVGMLLALALHDGLHLGTGGVD